MIGAMTSQDTQRTDAPGRLLRRRTSDRVIGGVAGGLGDYFNVDPLLIRIGFVGLIIFGGAGLVLYLVAWLLMPAEGQDLSPVEAVIRRIGMTPGRIITFAVVAVALLLLINSWNTGFNLSGREGVLWVAVVIVTGLLLIRRRETSPATAGVAEEQDASIIEGPIRRLGLTTGRIITFAVLAVVFLLLMNSWNVGFDYPGSSGWHWAVVVIVVGYLLIRRRETAPTASAVAAVAAVAPAPAVIAPPRAPTVRRPPSPLAWYVYAAVLIAIGVLALASQVGDVEVEPAQFFGAALAIMGIGLVIGAWWGRARILILLALLLMPLAVGASFVTAPLEGGIGAPRFTPANAAELRDEYRLLGGTMTLDLTELSVGWRPVHIAASVAVGQLVVILPRDASVELRTRAGAGQVTLFDEYTVGTGLDDVYVRHHQYGTTYILDLEVGIGDVLVINDIGGDF